MTVPWASMRLQVGSCSCRPLQSGMSDVPVPAMVDVDVTGAVAELGVDGGAVVGDDVAVTVGAAVEGVLEAVGVPVTEVSGLRWVADGSGLSVRVSVTVWVMVGPGGVVGRSEPS